MVKIFRQLDECICRLGFTRERDFTPHITIGRVKSQRNREELLRVMEGYRGKVFGTTPIDKVVLKKSVLTPSGPVYSNIREVELEG